MSNSGPVPVTRPRCPASNPSQDRGIRDELIDALKEFAVKKQRDWVTRKEFVAESGVSWKRVLKHFARWNNFTESAGLKPLGNKGRPDIDKGYSREELLTALSTFATEQQTDISSEAAFCKAIGISYKPIHRLFGDWNGFISVGGLKPHPMQKMRIADEELLDDYLRVVQSMNGRLPPYHEFAQVAKFSMGSYENRFGGFKGFRRQAVQRGIQLGIVQPAILPDETEEPSTSTEAAVSNRQPLDDRPLLGEEINVPGLVHAPLNEMGVVYLFGPLAEELGYRIESFNPIGFPDCEGKRLVSKGRLQRVRIEFEFRSSNFVLHKHDASKCDLIVCWIHDWKNSPIEVCCLKEIVSNSQRSARSI
jgi:hypothetical protein